MIAARHENFTLDDRLTLVLQLAETLDYAHRHGIVHRGLSPMSIDVVNPDALVPTLRIRDWHAGFQLEATDGHTRAVTSHAGLLVTDPARSYLAPEALTLGPDADTSQPAVFAPDFEPDVIAEIAKKLRKAAGLPEESTVVYANA